MLLSRLNKIETSLRKVKKCCECADGGSSISCCYYEVTRAEAETLVNESKLIKGELYKITDRGDRGIFLNAMSENKFQEEGVRFMLIPNGIRGGNNSNFDELYTYWNYQNIYNTGDIVFFNGRVWQSTIDSNEGQMPGEYFGSPGDLNPNWALISKNSFESNEYREKQFGIIYDFDNDWISKQWDEHNNEFGISFLEKTDFESNTYTYGNPVDLSDWNLADFGWMYDNQCAGIFGNFVSGSWDGGYPRGIYYNKLNGPIAYIWNYLYITYNTNNGIYGIFFIYVQNGYYITIYNNSNSGSILESWNQGNVEIYSNSNKGDIWFLETENNISINNNSNEGEIGSNYCSQIIYNSNKGTIFNNNITGIIQYNSNLGSISDNTNNGDIGYNSNSGGIWGNSNTFINSNSNLGPISNNSNNGEISYNSNLGSILANSNIGDIYKNSNNGDITFCSSGVNTCAIYNNINNGNISGTYAADVFDTIVNK